MESWANAIAVVAICAGLATCHYIDKRYAFENKVFEATQGQK